MKIKPLCINCGAQLKGCKCEYCGTEYESDENREVHIKPRWIDKLFIELEIDGEMRKFYVGNVEVQLADLMSYRGSVGVLHTGEPKTKRKITLIEY